MLFEIAGCRRTYFPKAFDGAAIIGQIVNVRNRADKRPEVQPTLRDLRVIGARGRSRPGNGPEVVHDVNQVDERALMIILRCVALGCLHGQVIQRKTLPANVAVKLTAGAGPLAPTTAP